MPGWQLSACERTPRALGTSPLLVCMVVAFDDCWDVLGETPGTLSLGSKAALAVSV